jgi:hypothetical protein
MAQKFPARDWDGAPLVLGFLIHTRPFRVDGKDGMDVSLVLRWHRAEPLAQRLAGTVDNKAGYGSPEAAQRVARQCANLLRQGVETTYDVSSWTHASVCLRWQQFDDTRYCDRDGGPTAIEADGDESIRGWESRVALYRWLEGQVKRRTKGGSLRDPWHLVEALRRMGAVPLLPWKERTALYGDDHVGWIATTYDDAFSRLPVKPAEARVAA